ncbi:ATPase AAA [Campylobacter mucosalis]|uniref:sigma-54-dependent transcriptional regulator n=1 Tax=Campylobacter mucosalis TaxID=202 RepID=UPI0004D5AFBE|nr:sigma-54 dependent transcriptional regulator [Campylobacter mucosalis]KEA46133.1 ATPase AAA [Campylobacter mucosalis]QKF62583.1 flagella-associated two-component system, response regulator [Campylobacter mucosalis]
MKVLIVEDDINMRKSLEIALADYDDLEVSSVKSATQALKQLSSIEPDIIITDINMPGLDGIEFIKELNGKFDVIIMTGNATLNRAIESVRLGVKDFLTKPFDVNTLYEAIKRVQKEREKISTKQIKISNIKSDFVGDSEALKRAKNIALKAAVTDASVMIMGESGVGKEVFANFIHQNSKRKDKPFIAINMAAIPENLIESELFGFEKGAFTDATTQKTGLFELANGGTLFLDEIGEMPINLQPKLLRAIQEREISRLGGTKPIKIDVRILCATNANLDELIKNAKFREDLFYRLNTIPLLIPPLRERKDEIEAIANAVLKKVCDEYELGEKSFSDEAISELLGYSYPGNIRELISITQRAAILSEGTKITADDLFLQGRKSR